MRKKQLSLIISFHTTTEAIKMDRYCMEESFPGRLIPIPREITAGCGMAWKALPEDYSVLLKGMEKGKITYDQIYVLAI